MYTNSACMLSQLHLYIHDMHISKGPTAYVVPSHANSNMCMLQGAYGCMHEKQHLLDKDEHAKYC